MTTPNFKKGVGRLATDRYDFEAHLQGRNPDGSAFVNSFRHKASQVDVDSPSLVYGNPANVEEALENIQGFITLLSNVGQGFVTVGDGYDTWHAADGNINFDPAIPTLDSLLIPIFNAISLGSGVPEAFKRVQHGGIVVIKAGTYVIANTIDVPPGIIIMGEGYGTKLVNITSLDIPAIGIEPTPKASPTPMPLFRILPDLNRIPNDEAVDPNVFMFSRSTKIANLVICDNFVENPILGANFYKLPQNKTGSNPLILQQAGSNLELINVYLLGRVNFTAGTVVNEATRFAIQLDNGTGLGTGTILKMNTCYVDGFSQPIQFASIGGRNDYLEIDNCKIRSHGYLNADGVTAGNNCIINMNDNNAVINGNFFYGNHDALTQVVYVESTLASPPLGGDLSNIVISSNDFTIGKNDITAVLGDIIIVNVAIIGFDQYAHILFFGNNANGGFSVGTTGVAGSTNLHVDANNITMQAAVSLGITTPNLSTSLASTAIVASTNINLTSPNISTSLTNTTITASTDINITSPNLTTSLSATSIVATSSISLDGAIFIKRVHTVSASPYTTDVTNSSIPDYLLLIDTTSVAITVNLPAHSTGRTLIIKDTGFNASVNNITLVRSGGTGNIDGYTGDRVMATNGASWTLVSDGTNWWIV